mmetsp:Transcript_35792/g.89992  ORF Transcript_35792/g.89992 Transcript_35792/m.89992 type:complete len:263 (-) Transcript_35792:529-1317(-)
MPTSAACANADCKASSSCLLMASASWRATCNPTCRAFPTPDMSRAAVLTRGKEEASGRFLTNSSRKAPSFASNSLPNGWMAPPLKARTSAVPAAWKPSHSRSKAHSDTSQVVMLATTTHKRLALVRATLSRRQSATNPTSPRRFALTRLTRITSFSQPWNASTDETWTKFLAAPGRLRRISATCAAYGVMMPISSPVILAGRACKIRSTSQDTHCASAGFTFDAPFDLSSASTCKKPSGPFTGSRGGLCLSASLTPLRRAPL